MKKFIALAIFFGVIFNSANCQSVSENADLAKNDTLIQKVESLMWKVCQQVQGEADITNGGVYPLVVVEKRAKLVSKCFNESQVYKRKFANAIYSLGILTASSSDITLEGYVGNVFNDLAGVTYEDLNP